MSSFFNKYGNACFLWQPATLVTMVTSARKPVGVIIPEWMLNVIIEMDTVTVNLATPAYSAMKVSYVHHRTSHHIFPSNGIQYCTLLKMCSFGSFDGWYQGHAQCEARVLDCRSILDLFSAYHISTLPTLAVYNLNTRCCV